MTVVEGLASAQRSPTPDEKLFLKLAITHGLINHAQAQALLQLSQKQPQTVQELAVSEGLLSPKHVQGLKRALLSSRIAHVDKLYAQILQSRGYISSQNLHKAQEVQRRRRYQVRLGEILVSAGVLSMERHTEILRLVLQTPSLTAQTVDAIQGVTTPPSELPAEPPSVARKLSSRRSSRRSGGSASRRQRPSRRRASAAPPAQPVFEIKGDEASNSGQSKSGLGLEDKPRRKSRRRRTQLSSQNSQNAEAGLETVSAAPAQRSSGSKTDDPLARPTFDSEFLESAIQIRLQDSKEDSALSAHDRELLKRDMETAETMRKSGTTFSQLDKITLSAASGDVFQPDEYFKRRRRSTLQKYFVQSVLASVAVIVLVLGFIIWSNRSKLSALQTALTELSQETKPREAHSRLNQCQTLFTSLGTLGLSDKDLWEAQTKLKSMRLVNEVRLASLDNKTEQARELVDRAWKERVKALETGQFPAVERETLESLERDVDFGELMNRAQGFLDMRAYGRAHGEYKKAQAMKLSSEQRAWHPTAPIRALQTIEAKLEKSFKLRAKALDSDPEDLSKRQEYRAARKQFLELFGRQLGQALKEPETMFKGLVQEGRELLRKNEAQNALEAFLEARNQKHSESLRYEVARSRELALFQYYFAKGLREEDLNHYQKALKAYRKAQSLNMTNNQVERLNRRIQVCEEKLKP